MSSAAMLKSADSKDIMMTSANDPEGRKPKVQSRNVFSIISFSWMLPILRLVRAKKVLDPEDMYHLPDDYTAAVNSEDFFRAWKVEMEKSKMKPSLFRTIIFRMERFPWFYIACLFYLLKVGCNLVQPVFFLYLLRWYTDETAPVGVGVGYVLGLTGFTLLGVIFDHQYQWKSQRALIKIRGALMSAVFQKSLKLSIASEDQSGISSWMTAMSVDVENIKSLVDIIAGLLLLPLEIIGIIGIMYSLVQEATFAGLGILILAVICTRVVGNLISSTGREKSKLTGQRTNLLSEVINGVKAIKFFAWESEFIKKLETVRKGEEKVLRKMSTFIVLTLTVTLAAPTIVMAVVFVVNYYQFGHNHLEISEIFPTLILLGMLRSLLYNLPQYQARFLSARVSMKRLEEYFVLPEIAERVLNDPSVSHGTVVIENGSFDWRPNFQGKPMLDNISAHVAPASLMAVIGEVGCGKSSFIMSILAEIPKLAGNVKTNGSIAYVPQQAWILNATIRENIIFGKPFDQRRYEEVLEACCLKTDMEILEKGDMTYIGDRGINLSGGQKQRVSLARALYFDADIYLLDDPLSAVDSHVGKALFHGCINGKMKGKTRIFVTNQTQYIPHCDEVILLVKGEVSISGKVSDVLDKLNLDGMRRAHRKSKHRKSKKDKNRKDKKPRLGEKKKSPSKTKLLEQGEGSHEQKDDEAHNDENNQKEDDNKNEEDGEDDDEDEDEEEEDKEKNDPENAAAAEEEEIRELGNNIETQSIKAGPSNRYSLKKLGSTNFSLFKGKNKKAGALKKPEVEERRGAFLMYVQSLRGWFAFFVLFVVQFLCMVGIMAQYIVLALWAVDALHADVDVYLGAFLGSCALYIVGQSIRSTTFSRLTEKTARRTHSKILRRVMRAPMSFFDVTPTGEILGWFTKDIFLLDVSLHTTSELTFVVTFSAVFYLIFIPINFPWVAIYFVPFFSAIYFLTYYYSTTLVEVKQLDANTCPPIYSQFKETLDGLACVRAFNAQNIFRETSERKTDVNNQAVYHLYALDHWLGFGIDTTGNSLSLVMCILIVLSKLYDNVVSDVMALPSGPGGNSLSPKAAVAAISLYLAVSVTTTVNFMVRNLVETDRILERYHKLDQVAKMPVEAPPVVEGNRPRESWPESGRLQLQKLYIKYRPDLDFVLREIDCVIEPKEKIGVVGRTGAGKSSLMTALFRLVEFSAGTILLDGVDISKIGLDDLRSKLAIINQDPVLFSGTVRSNLDPFEVHRDDEIWIALEQAHLKVLIAGLSGGLDAKVAANGENFSVGQRQQFSLARAMLRKPKVLVMDEATSSIDNDTDSLIQKAIREACKDTTVLTIAHRLNTIMDSDRVMVMDRGRIVEFARPSKLLENPKSHFTSMVEATGPVVSKQLRKMAK